MRDRSRFDLADMTGTIQQRLRILCADPLEQQT